MGPGASEPSASLSPWRQRLHEIIFEADTRAGRIFDIGLIAAILLSVVVVMFDSVRSISDRHHDALRAVEWVFTILFTVEYVLRLICVRKPLRYAVSFFGIVDLLAILPTFLTLLPWLAPSQELLVVRALRLLRVFRVFKLARLLSEAATLRRALILSRNKIAVFLATILIVVTIMGAAMHLVEGGPGSKFTSIPESMYWAIVTMTTVGYGDVTPRTSFGKALASLMIIVGYTLIIVPTGILSAELAQQRFKPITTQVCPDCSREGHDENATFCKFCGGRL